MKRLLVCFAAAALLSLTGCATRWVVDNDVNSFSRLSTVPANATYRFERLPSQQANEAQQRQLEAMAIPALQQVGLQPVVDGARYSVQIHARVAPELAPWADPWLVYGPWSPGWNAGAGFGRGYGRYGGFGGFGRYGYGGYGAFGPAVFPSSNPWFAREVGIVMRELPGGEVVYESHARNDGPYNISADIFPAMFEAALQGFPNPPAGPRRVNIQLGPKTPAKS